MTQQIKILIVDDDPDVLFATSRLVKKAGYAVMEASTGEAAVKIAREKKPDLILLDVVLPDIMGTEVCRQIKADPRTGGGYVILTSGMKTASDQQADGLDAGADGYISRPVSNRELIARIDAMVRILTAERERDQVIEELQQALAKIRKLSKLLPVCMHCKKIRDDKGYWSELEAYIRENTDTEFSHSICRECAQKYYPDMNLYDP
ncbi:MAG: response regulator [Desulfobacteraceae bacterium]|nr:response regulator [Desulfobacteraceae bacterium]